MRFNCATGLRRYLNFFKIIFLAQADFYFHSKRLKAFARFWVAANFDARLKISLLWNVRDRANFNDFYRARKLFFLNIYKIPPNYKIPF